VLIVRRLPNHASGVGVHPGYADADNEVGLN
jgi:hypothetical protein